MIGNILWVDGTTLEYMEANGERQALSVKDLAGSGSAQEHGVDVKFVSVEADPKMRIHE